MGVLFCFVLFCFVLVCFVLFCVFLSFCLLFFAFCFLLFLFCSLSLSFFFLFFLVACYATLHPAMSVRPSVRRSVGPSHFTFSAFMGFLAIPLLPKCSTDLKYGPCPPARDWGSHVSGLVLLRFQFHFFILSCCR